MRRILVLHGPNLNLLGRREQVLYGTTTLQSIDGGLVTFAEQEGLHLDIRQSNEEGELVTWIQEAQQGFDGMVINPAAYTHTSIAIRDAIAAAAIPAVEVHLTNIYAREEFRHQSYIAPVALGQVSGFGPYGYQLAIQALVRHLTLNQKG